MPAVGDMAPEFEMLNEEGKPVKLSDYRGQRVVLYFYPADFTSGCELQACSFRDSYDQIRAHNAVVFGVSPDGVDSHRKFREALKLPFMLLVDSDLKYIKTYGAWGPRPWKDNTEGLLRSQFVIDEQGRIIDTKVPISPRDSVPVALENLSTTTQA